MSGFYAVIPAGGSGTRLWPLSRAAHPKFLQDLTGSGRTLIQSTVDRLAPLAETDHVFVVTGGAHAVAVGRQLPSVPSDNIIVEPSARDSGPAIGLAAAVLHHRDPESIMGSFASDHLIRDEDTFVDVVSTAIEVAATGKLVTVGMTPTAPETGFGYVQVGAPLGIGKACAVERFAEKPSYEVAKSYVDSGDYLWNAGMFVWRTETFLAELARQLPDLYEGVARIAAAWDTPRRQDVLDEVWPSLPKISVDHGVMEGAAAEGLVATVPADFGWNDVGDWDSLAAVLPGPVLGEAASVVSIDSPGTLVVPASGRLVAVAGLVGMVVVDTPDALLVCPRSEAQQVKALVDELKARGQTERV